MIRGVSYVPGDEVISAQDDLIDELRKQADGYWALVGELSKTIDDYQRILAEYDRGDADDNLTAQAASLRSQVRDAWRKRLGITPCPLCGEDVWLSNYYPHSGTVVHYETDEVFCAEAIEQREAGSTWRSIAETNGTTWQEARRLVTDHVRRTEPAGS